MAETFENLEIWKESMNLAEVIYKISQDFPGEEKFGLTSQIRRAVISISSNIAEGSNRKSADDFKRFIHIARGSLNEVESQLILSYRLQYITKSQLEQVRKLIDKLGGKIGSFRNHLKNT